MSTAAAGDDELDGDAGDDLIFAGPATTRSPATRATTPSTPVRRADDLYGEEGYNKIVATDDGVRDDIFCNQIVVPAPPGIIVYIGHRDPLDALRNCKVIVK